MLADAKRLVHLVVIFCLPAHVLAVFDRCSYQTDPYWFTGDEFQFQVYNLTADSEKVKDPTSPNGLRNVSWASMSVSSGVWDGIMDCRAQDHLVQPSHYGGDPEAGLIYDACTPRAGFVADHYWLSVAPVGLTVEATNGSLFHAFVFNETFTCENDPSNIITIERHVEWLPSNGGFNGWRCNNEIEARHETAAMGHCEFINKNVTAWPSVFISHAHIINPAPDRSCAARSRRPINWEISNFSLTPLLYLIYSMNLLGAMVAVTDYSSGPPTAYLRFRMVNLATGYISRPECTIRQTSLQPNNDVGSNVWFDCNDPSVRDYDVIPTKFSYNPMTGDFNVRQEWECESEQGTGSRTKFVAVGSTKVPLVDCQIQQVCGAESGGCNELDRFDGGPGWPQLGRTGSVCKPSANRFQIQGKLLEPPDAAGGNGSASAIWYSAQDFDECMKAVPSSAGVTWKLENLQYLAYTKDLTRDVFEGDVVPGFPGFDFTLPFFGGTTRDKQLTFTNTNSFNNFSEWCFVAHQENDSPSPTYLKYGTSLSEWHVCNNQFRYTPETYPVTTNIKFSRETNVLSIQQTYYCLDTSAARRVEKFTAYGEKSLDEWNDCQERPGQLSKVSSCDLQSVTVLGRVNEPGSRPA